MAGTNVLVVEDDQDLRKDIVKLLKSRGVYADDAGLYREARRLIANKSNSGKYRLLVCDTSLGKPDDNMFGIDVARTFREKNPDGIVIGMSSSIFSREYWDGHANEFYVKPLDGQKIDEILKKYFLKTP